MERRGVIVGVLIAVAGVIVAVSAGLFSTNSRIPPRAARVLASPTPTRTPFATPTAGPRPPTRVRTLIAEVDAVCSIVGPLQRIPEAEDLDRDASPIREELKTLEALLAELRRLTIPAKLRADMKVYRRRLQAQIRLDRLIVGAAQRGDRQSVRLGMAQNDWNRSERTKVAADMGFKSCLADPGRA